MRGRALRAAYAVLLILLVVPAAALTLTRILEPSVNLFVQAEAFLPLALPVYLVALVAVVAGLVTVWRRRRAVHRVLAPVAVVVLAGLVLHAVWFAPLVSGSTPPADPDAEPLTVMSANLLTGDADADDLVRAVRDDHVDVLVAVEITTDVLDGMERAGLDDLLPHRVGAAAPPGGIDGTMVFARDRVRLLETIRTRSDSLLVDVGGVRLLAVHPRPPWFQNRWLRDHDRLLAAARAAEPDVIVGDFNAALDHPPMRAYGDLGYRDAVELTNAGFQPTWPTVVHDPELAVFRPFGPLTAIDHVLVSRRWTALDVSAHDLAGTDHRYLVARVAPRG